MRHSILYLTWKPVIWGAETSFLLLLTHLDLTLFNPVVVVPSKGPLVDRLAQLGVETIITPLERLRWRNPFPYLKTVHRLARLVADKNISLVHSNIEFCNQYAAMAARIKGVPHICHVRNIIGRLAFWELFLGLSNVLIANSKATAEGFRRYAKKRQRVEVIYNGLELDKFDSSRGSNNSFRQKLGIDGKTFLIGQVARIVPAKGQHILIRAMAEVVKTCPDAKALIVGDAKSEATYSYLAELEKQVAEFQLKDNVMFAGYVENIVELYASLDLVVLPSLAEPFGRSLIEAMAMGKPVVATRAGGAVEVVENEVTGLVVETDGVAGLASAILKIKADKALAAKFGENGRKRVERLFDIQENVQKIEQIYRDILANE